jgi:hypothetical protein
MGKNRPINKNYCVVDREGDLERSYPEVYNRVREFILPQTAFGRIIQPHYKDYIGYTHDFVERYDRHKNKWNTFQKDPDKIIDSIINPGKYKKVKRPDLMYILYATNNFTAAKLMERTLLHDFEKYVSNDPFAKNTSPKETKPPYFIYLIVNMYVI